MRALTEEEMKAFFEKLANFIGPSIKDLLDRSDQPHVFRLHKDRV
jgi:60S ribosome subunit biogenesis protein NIP7